MSTVLPVSPAKALQVFLQKAPKLQRALGTAVLNSEGVVGNQHTLFAQSVGSVWLPKALVARSMAEQAEQFFLEFVETALFFYSIPFLAEKAFNPLGHKLAGKAFSSKLLTKTLPELIKHNPNQLKAVVPVKAAVIVASLSVICAEYALSFVKNLQTEKVFRKSKFSDVVNLSQGGLKQDELSPVAQKAYKRIIQCAGVAATCLTAAGLIAAFGSRSKGVYQLSEKLVKNFDLAYEGGRAGLSKALQLPVIWAGVASYIDASRDKLETQEIITRVACVVAPYYSFGKELVQRIAVGFFGNKAPQILTANKTNVKKFNELAADVLKQAGQKLGSNGKPLTNGKLLEEANKLFQPILRAKNNIFWGPQLFGVVVVGFTTALLSQYWTQVRFQKAEEAKRIASRHKGIEAKDVYGLYPYLPGFQGRTGQATPAQFSAQRAEIKHQYTR